MKTYKETATRVDFKHPNMDRFAMGERLITTKNYDYENNSMERINRRTERKFCIGKQGNVKIGFLSGCKYCYICSLIVSFWNL